MMKHIKRKKSLQASAPANILSQLETSLINKQVNISSSEISMYLAKSKLECICLGECKNSVLVKLTVLKDATLEN